MPDGFGVDPLALDRALLIAVARESITAKLESREARIPSCPASLKAPMGAFVTLRVGKGRQAPLRGCIGRLNAQDSLFNTVRDMAIASAFHDPRFPPVEKSELPGLWLEITALSPMRPAKVEDIEVGRHGVYMTMGGHGAVFLPQVATEQGWDRDELLENLCQKAGLTASAWRSVEATFQVFEGIIIDQEPD